MDQIPRPFSDFIEIKSGERLLACWYATRVRVTPQGEIANEQTQLVGEVLQYPQTPDVLTGLLILTDKGLLHCRALRAGLVFAPFTKRVVVDAKVALVGIQGVEIVELADDPRPLLIVKARRNALTLGATVAPDPSATSCNPSRSGLSIAHAG